MRGGSSAMAGRWGLRRALGGTLITVLWGACPAACGKAVLSSPEGAAASVQRAQVVAGTVGLAQGKKLALAPRSRGYFLPSSEYKANTTAVDLAQMKNVVAIDKERMVMHVEPMMTMEGLVRAALAHGMVPKVVAPFRDVTVGGAIAGGVVSSASHKHGLFHEACSYIEVALGNGTLVNCSRTEHAELFNSVAGSYGTLGVVTRVGVECEPAGRFVRVAYSRHGQLDDALAHVKRICRYGQPPDLPPDVPVPSFMDAVVLGGVGGGQERVLVAHAWHELTPPQKGDPKLPMFECHRGWDVFYSEHLEDVSALLESASKGRPAAYEYTERMPTEDYLFRFDRGAYWLAKSRGSGGPMVLTSAWLSALAYRTVFARLFCRWLLRSSTLFLLLRMATPELLASRFVFMSAALPVDRARDLVTFTRRTVPVRTPLYLCPVRGAHVRQPFAPHGHVHTLFMQVGICGRVDDGKGREHSRRLEAFIAAQQGRKMLCTQNFYSADEFWKGFPLYNHEEYRYLREKYAAEGHFPELGHKVLEGRGAKKGLLQRYLDNRRAKLLSIVL